MTEPTTDPTHPEPAQAPDVSENVPTLSYTAPIPETPAETEAKRGRGATRPAIRFADLADALADAPDAVRERALLAVERETTAVELRAGIRTAKADLRAHVLGTERDIATAETVAALIEEADKLPDHLRRALLATFAEVDPAETPEG